MKNKKLVATVASLCLVVVAVVAAVVGVFAAATQNVNNTFSVSYTAKDVYATVEMRSMGPKLTSGRAMANPEAFVSGNTASGTIDFYPLETTRTESRTSVTTYSYGWTDDAGAGSNTFLGYSIYEFKFTNNNTDGRAMTVTPTAVMDDDLDVFYFRGQIGLDSTATNVSVLLGETAIANNSWSNPGVFNGAWSDATPSTSNVKLKVNSTATALSAEKDAPTFEVAQGTPQYLFVVLVVHDVTQTPENSTFTSRLNFALTNKAA